ncbi:MAG: sugar phosphate isomerase/epimerase [Oscillospiraceae bacterium]|jgi:2-keto-myo-inositol isomerase|nr:sugar phosphate isomerase/epimerase [Oscillospiraceae bacterium]
MLIGYQEGTGIGCADSTFEKDLFLCEQVGFDVFEIRFDALARYLVAHSIKEVKDFFASSRIKPHCMGGHFILPDDFVGKDAGSKERDAALMTRFIAMCHIAGQIGERYFLIINHLLQKRTSSGMMADILDQDYPYPRDQVTEFSIRILRRFCAVAADYGISIAWEPVCGRGGSVKTMDHAMEIINGTGCDNIGLCLDSFNQYINGKNNDFSIYNGIPSEKIITVHINNCDDEPLGALSPQHRRFVDSGAIDLDNCLQNLKAIGYKGPISIETLRPEYYSWPIEKVIKEAYRTTSELVGRWRG